MHRRTPRKALLRQRRRRLADRVVRDSQQHQIGADFSKHIDRLRADRLRQRRAVFARAAVDGRYGIAARVQQTRQCRANFPRADDGERRFQGADAVPSGVGVGIGSLM